MVRSVKTPEKTTKTTKAKKVEKAVETPAPVNEMTPALHVSPLRILLSLYLRE